MKILAVDTALGACSAAVLDGGRILGHIFELMERGHAEALAPMVESVMTRAAIGFADLDRLAVTIGPGTFTGQRVGLAFMRGLRLALGKPLVGITTMRAMCAAAAADENLNLAAALHDARRGEVYVGLASQNEELMAPHLLPLGQALGEIAAHAKDRPIALCGTAAKTAAIALAERNVPFRLTSIRSPDALWVARLAEAAPEPCEVPKPLYLRPPDARLPA